MGFLADFKAFAMRGNVVDMAVGVVIGAAFGKIVSSLVTDVIMPPLGLALGKVDFRQKFLALDGGDYPNLQAALDKKAPVMTWGNFVQNTVDFLIIAFAIFLVVKAITRFMPKPAPAPPPPAKTKECPQCCSPIALAAKRCPCCTAQIG